MGRRCTESKYCIERERERERGREGGREREREKWGGREGGRDSVLWFHVHNWVGKLKLGSVSQ